MIELYLELPTYGYLAESLCTLSGMLAAESVAPPVSENSLLPFVIAVMLIALIVGSLLPTD